MTEAIHRLYEASKIGNSHYLGLLEEPNRPVTTFAILEALGLIKLGSDKAALIQDILATDVARDRELTANIAQCRPLPWNQVLESPLNAPDYTYEQPEPLTTTAPSEIKGQQTKMEFYPLYELQQPDEYAETQAFVEPSGYPDIFLNESFWQIPTNSEMEWANESQHFFQDQSYVCSYICPPPSACPCLDMEI
ncbi:uncharacterized protein PV07_04712 [Cladophialophora immunda]|uniref:Uncharacterized protein n=1 Tax=Cladophialophora immunda TaxID=569365 RepID=A0A0D2CZ48_9EURO|nr:uncharacterized protein PV07_04712 [Cladophialophora immunda]KIW28849.1 hypothetical protein PV07_04712 [Cladophialophora immunda]